ncbi:MAG: glycosyltransferase family 4 protein, partial [Lachnospiraceae bacterium]
MNVLMIVSWYTPKGREKLEAGVFHYEQSMDLKKYCNVAIYYPFDQDISEDETKAEEWGLTTYRSKYIPGKILHTKLQMKKTMGRIMKEFKPDIIHAHCAGAAGYYASSIAKKYQLPMVITEHSPVELTGVDKTGISYFFSKKAYGCSKANICVSKDSRDKLAKIYPKYSFDVIYNGIILPEYDQGTKKYYKDGYVNVAIVAILYDLEIKGMKYLLKAMEILKSQGKKFILHHIGGGEYLEHFKKMAVDLGIEDVCIFYGGCDRKKLYEIVNEMDFFVSSSLIEC